MTDGTFKGSGIPFQEAQPGLAKALLIVWRFAWRWLTAEHRRRQLLSYTVGFGFAVVCFFFAWVLHGSSASTYRIDSEWSAFAGLFILALAIERALEPFSRKLGPDSTEHKKGRDRAGVETCRRLTAVVTWGVATGLAFLLCAQLNITLLQAVRANGSGQPPFWADLLVTGLVVGAGTKPLHDLVSNIECSKDAKQPLSRRWGRPTPAGAPWRGVPARPNRDQPGPATVPAPGGPPGGG